ncbi:phosphate-binding protein [Mycobacterium florentinum]|uniref:Phosphate-binding protein n=1 Tax=Mycobacterium florentinum TaxID=292462 RepID=A0A1X1UL07_MYCFL|nr:phosphate ABC transporter substrate-binding protein PstS [Mycobacterium florentinum]MCV7411365.1 phosphate ABC transporter substrate-binding protein PstS [Mycobacterium florentinum]ORV57471.1 phosphate-binding protein [Mycobacterium florentinum]BBX80724.1 phosphate-binding protein PstS 3 [Mycobacterium florentinum]
MRIIRLGAVRCVLATVALVLSACGHDNTATGEKTTTPAAPVRVVCGGKPKLKGSGSTAQANAMTRFVKAYEQACPGHTVNYLPNGSGSGISEFTGDQSDFAGSDSTLAPGEYAAAQRRCGSPAWQLPVVIGPIAITYNVDGLTSLTLDGQTAARIFNGGITRWNDLAIQELNPGVSLPAEPIQVVFRGDESGTTDNFQKYLDATSKGAWGRGAGKKFNGGVGEGAKGNDGTSAAVKANDGSISYNEWSFAQAQHLGTAKIVTSAGPDPVAISADSVGKTISGAPIVGQGNDLALDTASFYRPNQPGAYPIVLATYEVVCSKYPDPEVGAAVKAFLQSTIGAGQNGLADNGYVRVPDTFIFRLSVAVNAIA